MRLIIYILTVLLLIVGGLAFSQVAVNKVRKERIENLNNQLVQAKESLQALDKATAASSAATTELVSKLAGVDEKGSAIKERVVYLERTNEKVRDLLSTALPDGGCLLDNSCGSAEVHWSEPGVAALVHPTQGSQGADRARRGEQQ